MLDSIPLIIKIIHLNLDSFINLLLSFTIKTCTNKCRKLTQKLKITCHRNIAQEVNARLQEVDEINSVMK